jgi:hypothetical protein
VSIGKAQSSITSVPDAAGSQMHVAAIYRKVTSDTKRTGTDVCGSDYIIIIIIIIIIITANG